MTDGLENLSETEASILAKITGIETKHDKNLLELGEELKKTNSKIDQISEEIMRKHLEVEKKIGATNETNSLQIVNGQESTKIESEEIKLVELEEKTKEKEEFEVDVPSNEKNS